MLFTDWNRSGTPSLRVSNDREYYEGGQEQMWKVEPGKAPALYTAEEGWKNLRIWGMGIASYDLNFDGYPEYFLTSMADNKLQTLAAVPTDGSAPKPSYADVAFAKGVTAHRPYMGDDLKPSTGWHTQFEDVNNDGLVDLFIAKGNVWEMPDFAMKDPNNLLLQTAGRQVQEVGDKAGVASVEQARGAALADFNLDGLLDLVVVNRNSPAQLWRNTSADAGHWIAGEARAAGRRTATRSARGSRCAARAASVMRREITVGGGHAGGQSGWWHFGSATNPRRRCASSGRTGRRATGSRSKRTASMSWSAARRRRSRRRYLDPGLRRSVHATCRSAARGRARAKISWSTKVSARMAQPSRMSGSSSAIVSKEMASECRPPAVLAIASRIAASIRSKAAAPLPTKATGRRVDQREQAAETVADRRAGLAVGLALADRRLARARPASACMSASVMSSSGVGVLALRHARCARSRSCRHRPRRSRAGRSGRARRPADGSCGRTRRPTTACR